MPLTVLITGSNRGLGLEFTKQYAEAGWEVIACCRNPQESDELLQLATQHKGVINLHRLDIADFAQIDKLAVELVGQEIDVLLNNAGIYPDANSGSFGATNYEAWAHAFRVNTMAPLKMAETFSSHVARSTQKKIVCITSKMGSIADNTSGGHYLYRSSKTALNMTVKSLAIDLAPRGITTIVLHPGWVQTDMGGYNAPTTPTQSIAGMRQVIERITLKDSGKFYGFDGQEIPW